ncbi:protein of unknown function [Gracilimonas mengyeensis]|uniref:DUF4956 domain-containing protein n=2 Tax=Gracilimonas mengyeensis TaxID=1302730 RepID=A0A521BK58_9BACT|nr:protein of unknown function [Gracilimonas mengyeensis]
MKFGDTAPLPTDIPTLLIALLLAFLCGQLLAWIYMYTHTGLSYSRTFVSSLIIMPITVALVMMILDNNIVTAFSLLAVFAIVRFRNILRDTLDTVYILSLIVIGMACGTQKFTTALIGTLVAGSVLIYIWFTNFGARQRYDLILNLNWSRPLSSLEALEQFLDRHAFKTHLASQNTSHDGSSTQLSYRLLLRNPDRTQDLLNEIAEIQGVSKVSSMVAEDESEV